jgi:hypothetical protein
MAATNLSDRIVIVNPWPKTTTLVELGHQSSIRRFV